MTIRGVLFDFSGTLFRGEPVDAWLSAALDACAITLPEAELARYAMRLEAAGALPSGPHPPRVPAHLAQEWSVRDTSGDLHRRAYTGLSRTVELPDPRLYDALYDRHMTPAAWRPYGDARPVLAALRERGIGVGVVSNIGWDLRPVFRAHGLDDFVDAYALSFEHGAQKPEERLFRVACEALGQAPEEVLMVGDNRRADGGAAALGCAVHFVDPLPVEQRPDALRAVLALAAGDTGPGRG
ncbi:HAD family hydrolase [Streptomyces sp. NBC_00083]|uniref:HAD family hydrolase n=1 Tax=Streptomyces sp. NBC_00083 TaxID=2975647 RepID=UPI002259AD77|nr:HAD family hydrolase [Streptomyces sp. NBC_00083]MCX5383856.1 HAD family hydrolase [Streptomyces sp. NBC_00083]